MKTVLDSASVKSKMRAFFYESWYNICTLRAVEISILPPSMQKAGPDKSWPAFLFYVISHLPDVDGVSSEAGRYYDVQPFREVGVFDHCFSVDADGAFW